MKYLLVTVLMLSVVNCYSESAGLLNEDGSFKLREGSIKTLGVEFYKLAHSGPWLVPSESIINIKFSKGIYRRYEGSITFVLINILKVDKDKVLISSPDLEIGDEVAIKGTTFLRLTEADLKSDTVDACAH